MIQVHFGEVRVSPLADAPVLVLIEDGGGRRLPIWISAMAGTAILSALESEDADHPCTHDLLMNLLASRDAEIEAVHITGVSDGLYSAQLLIGGAPIACRPSDGVALALRCGAPIFTTEEVLQGNALDAAGADEGAEADPLEADEVELFRVFLDNVRAEDFEEPHD